jgi:hypothetical protein
MVELLINSSYVWPTIFSMEYINKSRYLYSVLGKCPWCTLALTRDINCIYLYTPESGRLPGIPWH